MSATEIVRIEQLSFAYPNEKDDVIRNLSLEIEPGTVTAVLGPNGCGKTTLLHLILGWLRPQSGQIWIGQRALEHFSRRELGQWIGLVPQTEHIPFEFSLLEFVLLGRAPYLAPLAMPAAEDYQIAEEALEKVGMASMRHRSILNLSGGERQLVLVARALAQQPRLLLLDEPTSHLDLSNKKRLIELLRGFSQQGMTILFTTHEPEVASNLASHLVLVKKGEILCKGLLDTTLSSQNLSELFQFPIEVIETGGKHFVLWA